MSRLLPYSTQRLGDIYSIHKLKPFIVDYYYTASPNSIGTIWAVHPVPVGGAGYSAMGQSFAADTKRRINKAVFQLRKVSLPVGVLVAELYEIDPARVHGTSAIPTGSALATSNPINIEDLTTSFALYDFEFSRNERYRLTGDYYCIEVIIQSATLIDASNNVQVGRVINGAVHAGNANVWLDGRWGYWSNRDLVFYVYAA